MTISPAATATADTIETITDVPHPPPPRPAGPGPRTALGTTLGAGLASWLGRRRVWALYTAFALYAGAVAVFSGPGDDRSWGIWAAFGYAAAAALAARWPGHAGRRAALAASLAGALAAPVVWLATQASATPDVHVVKGSAVLLLHHGTPYLDPAQLAQGNVLSYNPYLPVMTVFGLPHALGLPGLAGDTRPWLVLATLLLLAAALRIAGPASRTRGAALGLAAFATASPVLAFPLAQGITDPPMIALTVLALALLARPAARIWPAALVLGAACAMKYTAWPALIVLAAMLAARDGTRAAARFTLLTCAAAAALTAALAPAALAAPAGLIRSTVLFPLGLTAARSPAQSPLPGHALATLGHAGHLAAIALLVVAGLGLAVSLVIRPPPDTCAAARRIALGLALMFALSPVTRFGYFAYPIGLFAWTGLRRGGLPDRDQPDSAPRFSPARVAGMPAWASDTPVSPIGRLPGGHRVQGPDRPAQHSRRVGGRAVSRPDDVLVGPDQDEALTVRRSPVVEGVGDHLQRYPQRPRRGLERGGWSRIPGQRDQRERAAEVLEDVAARGQRGRRQVMPRPRLEGVLAADAGRRARGPADDGRAFVVRLVPGRGRLPAGHAAPRPLEVAAVATRAVALEERAILRDALRDHFCGPGDDRAPLPRVAVEQLRSAPASQYRGQLPSQVHRVLKPGVEAMRAVWRMAVRRIAGDEHPAATVAARDVYPQIPETHVFERARHRRSRSPPDQGMDVEVLNGRVPADRRVEEPRPGGVNPPEESPVPLELGVQHPVRCPLRKALQARVQFARPEHREDHALVEVRPAALNARLLTHPRVCPVAADQVVALDLAAFPAQVLHCRHADAVGLFGDAGGRPSEHGGDRVQLPHPVAQHGFGQVLGQPFVPLVVEIGDRLAAGRGVPELAFEVFVRRDSPDREPGRQQAGRVQLVGTVPEVEVLQAPCGEVLPLRDR
jgi:hypothetical protein